MVKAADNVKKWIDGVGEAEAARLAAAIVTTFPNTTMEQALILAAERKLGGVDSGAAVTATTDVASPKEGELGSATKPIVLN